MTALEGTQPTVRQSPPSRYFSTSATFAPRPAAPAAVDQPGRPRANDDQVVTGRRGRVMPLRRVEIGNEPRIVRVHRRDQDGLRVVAHALRPLLRRRAAADLRRQRLPRQARHKHRHRHRGQQADAV